MSVRHLALLAMAGLVLQGCSQQQHNDLEQFMAAERAKPAGEIEPLPTFSPYKTFNYAAMALRSPFEAPLLLGPEEDIQGREAVEPDRTRKKEHLEYFNFSALMLVGTVTKDGVMWSLINDGEGGIHRVKEGNYLGRNHGRIVSVGAARVDVVEIVPDGKGSWVERPRVLSLQEKG